MRVCAETGAQKGHCARITASDRSREVFHVPVRGRHGQLRRCLSGRQFNTAPRKANGSARLRPAAASRTATGTATARIVPPARRQRQGDRHQRRQRLDQQGAAPQHAAGLAIVHGQDPGRRGDQADHQRRFQPDGAQGRHDACRAGRFRRAAERRCPARAGRAARPRRSSAPGPRRPAPHAASRSGGRAPAGDASRRTARCEWQRRRSPARRGSDPAARYSPGNRTLSPVHRTESAEKTTPIASPIHGSQPAK